MNELLEQGVMATSYLTYIDQSLSLDSVVGCVGPWFWWTKFGLHVQAWKPHVEFGVLLSKGTQFPRSISITQRCENQQETQVSATIGHPEPHDLWGHWANIRHVLPLFTLSPHRSLHVPSQRRRVAATLVFSKPAPSTNPLRGPRAAQPFSCIAAGCPAGLLTSSLLIQLFMEESCSFQLTSSHQGTSSQHKLYHPCI